MKIKEIIENTIIKQFIYILIIFVGLVSSCSLGDNKPRSTSRLLPEPDIMERLEGQKNIIDTQFQQNKNKIIVLAKPFANDEPMQIGREDVPNIVNSVFSILKDSSGQIIAAYEPCVSEVTANLFQHFCVPDVLMVWAAGLFWHITLTNTAEHSLLKGKSMEFSQKGQCMRYERNIMTTTFD